MTPDERAELDKAKQDLEDLKRIVVANGFRRLSDGTIQFAGEEAFKQAVLAGGSLYLGLGDTQESLGKLTELVGALPDVAGDNLSPIELAAIKAELLKVIESIGRPAGE